MSASAQFLVNDPPELAHVGNRLAFEVALMHKATNQDLPDESWDQPGVSWVESMSLADPLGEDEYFSEDFPYEFYLDKSKFLEQEDEAFVGFQVEADKLLQQLASITKKQLRVISIVGMAGLGKTTLAARLYNHPYVVSYFYVRSWITLTQNYQKRDLLLAFLRSGIEITDEVCRMTDNMLANFEVDWWASVEESVVSQLFFKDVSIIWDTSKLIRALDISSIELFVFPSELLQLVHLRYLELRFRSGNPPESISELGELQTLIMSSRMNVVVPMNMWKMMNLRHLCIRSGENLVNLSNVEEEHNFLENLQTMSLVSPTRPCQHVLDRTRNLQKLGLCGPLMTKSGDLRCPDLGLLMHLETLKLLNTIPLRKAGRLSTSIIFPESLKNLTVSNTYLDWKEAWVFVMIPNLEVLKLKFHAFVGEEWITSPEAFLRLRYLKLDELDIVTWIASRNHFPVLQRLQLYRCTSLMEIPEDFGDICTLEWIELSGCSDAATNSARDIQKDQESNGNDGLKILLNPGPTKPKHKNAGRSGY
ncbi:hypothetical protein POM88_015784 [Heracleum sosnowskyi]|uniref:NB-ARC domain-containing protein n=1 Tax=Heracleum sosnowskyi TaxID=360622 RepID=A0AAD8ILB7_9APIA|nr:hypothetical protein POM88_015784 [Heracleum sosnowskyi]